MNIRKVLLFAVFSIAIAVVSCAGQRYFMARQDMKRYLLAEKERAGAWHNMVSQIDAQIRAFKGDAGIVIKDLRSGLEYSHNKDEAFPSASLTKIPIMAAAFMAAEEGRLDLAREVALKPADKLTGSGVLKDMPAGSTFSLERLIGLMIYESDNTATNIVTSAVGKDYLNKAFGDFGLKHTHLARRIADYRSRDKGIENYTTAGDMALILEKMYKGSLVNRSVSKQCVNMMKMTRSSDRIAKYLPEDIAIAHKTGLEKTVCHDVGIIYMKKGDFIIAVLTRHHNHTSAASKEFIAKVSLYAYNYFEKAR